MKLTPYQHGLLSVFNRSHKDPGGWAKVSAMLWPLLIDLPADLFEFDGNADHGGRMRLTPKGQVVVPYL